MASRQALNQGVLAEAAGLSQANTSKHLVCLVQVGLVAREREGSLAYFSLVGPLVPNVCGLVKEHVVNRMQSAYQALR
jgi:DNA-binding transcriptional ArsR family regulator